MSSDPANSQPVPSYFLQEASELLQQIDAELQTLRQNFSVQKVHTLMRLAHTLKGAAASVGLDAIKTTTHSLEDAFRALCAPESVLEPAVEGLIFDAYDCLQLLLSAQLYNTQIDESDILDRMAVVVSQLQANLGEQFGQDAYLPTSADLGFDMTQSVFEVGVTQRLNDLETALANAQPDELRILLESHAEVFIGLAESLNLPGFGDIANAVLKALQKQPDQAVTIAKLALKDYRTGQALVLQGDRNQGGQPSHALRQLGGGRAAGLGQQSQGWWQRLWRRLNQPIGGAKPAPVAIAPPPAIGPAAVSGALDRMPEAPAAPVPAADTTARLSQLAQQPKPPILAESAPAASPSGPAVLRVPVEQLDQLNQTIGDLLTQQNQQALYNERLAAVLDSLQQRLSQQKLQLQQLQQWAIHSRREMTPVVRPSSVASQFDTLEFDEYSDLQLQLQAPLDNIVQQLESTEALELYLRQSTAAGEQQRRQVSGLRDILFNLRMQPLDSVFQRFPQVVERLVAQYGKPAKLKIRGGDVLIDKVIADKLYDPLLHLVRNAYDHGIEPLDQRRSQGKPGPGKIRLYGYQSGRYLMLELRDNGRGLDLEQIRAKAIENHIISPQQAQQLTPAQTAELIFEPGFSTAGEIDDLSGRGVGLDAVRSQVQALQGQVNVTHTPGRGTCFTLQIPSNLTIAKLLVCQAGQRLYALMADTLEQIVVPAARQLQGQGRDKVLSWRLKGKEQLVPIVSLAQVLDYQAALPDRNWDDPLPASAPILILRSQDRYVGLEVERLVGEQELAIRSLGQLEGMPAYVFGGSILADGRLSLVIDGAVLAAKALDPDGAATAFRRVPRHQLGFEERPVPVSQTILVIDDSVTVRQTLSQTLEKAGYRVVQAKDGGEGLQLLQHTQAAAIFCDVEMPGINGFEFLKRRQTRPEIAAVPTIMLTSRTGPKHRELADELGATAYLTKPYLGPQLLEVLAQVLQPGAPLQTVSEEDHG